MKPFDVQAALRGEPIRCRSNEYEMKFAAYNPEADSDKRVLVWMRLKGTKGLGFRAFYANGAVYKEGESSLDLFMAPRKRVVWERRFMDGFGLVSAVFSADAGSWVIADDRFTIDISNTHWLAPAFPVEIEE